MLRWPFGRCWVASRRCIERAVLRRPFGRCWVASRRCSGRPFRIAGPPLDIALAAIWALLDRLSALLWLPLGVAGPPLLPFWLSGRCAPIRNISCGAPGRVPGGTVPQWGTLPGHKITRREDPGSPQIAARCESSCYPPVLCGSGSIWRELLFRMARSILVLLARTSVPYGAVALALRGLFPFLYGSGKW